MKMVHTHVCMYVCMYNISPPLKIYQSNKNGINVVLYLFVIIKSIFKMHIIYETYNVFFNI
jgi:hypothetical protein